MPTFCRHNRFIERCPVCSKDLPEDSPLRARPSGSSHAGARRSTAARTPPAGARSAARRAPRGESLRVRHELRAQDDGYSSPLVPGLHASADAERLAGEIAFSRARLIGLSLAPPGRYAEAKELATSDLEQATLICFDLAATPATPATSVTSVTSVTSEEPDRLAERREAYRGWIERSGGSQAEAFRGDPSWTPERRFDRLFERLALPGFPRGPRYELLVILGRLGLYELRAGSLQFAGAAGSGDDATTLAAKRIFAIGDPLLLERRAGALAGAIDVPIEALDLALANWAVGGAGGAEGAGGAGGRETRGWAADGLDEDCLARAREVLGL